MATPFSHRRRARRARLASRGFTLIELMVVVVVIAVLAALAIPNMQAAREDRLAFRTADQFARIIHEAQTRAQGRGAAELVVITSNGTTDRGRIATYESVGPAVPPALIGPPVSACTAPLEWAGVPAGTPQNIMLNAADANGPAGSLQVTAGLESTLSVGGAAAVAVVVVCFTPGGKVYVTSGAALPAALTALETAPAFTTNVIMTVVRKPGGALPPVGLSRQVIMTSAGAVRIHSK